jgi:hypothetical protein
MNPTESQPTTTKPSFRWFHLTPGRLLVAPLAVEGSLFLAEWFRWLPKAWPVLIAIAAVAVVMLVMLLWFAVALVFHWWFQFSIRSLLVLVVVVAILCSWLTVERQDATKQWAAAAAIVKFGGSVLYEYQTVLYEDSVHKSGSPILGEPSSPSWLRNRLGQDFFHDVTTLFVHSDDGLERPKGLPQLQKAYLVGSQITDKGVRNLEACVRLQKVYLDHTQVTEEGVKRLQQALPNCKIIWEPPTPHERHTRATPDQPGG